MNKWKENVSLSNVLSVLYILCLVTKQYSIIYACDPKHNIKRKKSIFTPVFATSWKSPLFPLHQNKSHRDFYHCFMSGKVVPRSEYSVWFWDACFVAHWAAIWVWNVLGILLTRCEKNERDFPFWSISRSVSEVLALSAAGCDNRDGCSGLNSPAACWLYLPTGV